MYSYLYIQLISVANLFLSPAGFHQPLQGREFDIRNQNRNRKKNGNIQNDFILARHPPCSLRSLRSTRPLPAYHALLWSRSRSNFQEFPTTPHQPSSDTHTHIREPLPYYSVPPSTHPPAYLPCLPNQTITIRHIFKARLVCRLPFDRLG